MLAPANPVAPVTRTVWLMPRPADLLGSGLARVDLVGAVGDHGLARAVQVQRVQEAVQSHGVGTGEPQLHDLRRGEELAELAIGLVVDGVVVGREEVEELHGQPLLLRQVAAVARSDEAGDILVRDGVVLPRLAAGLALARAGRCGCAAAR